jgi:hypothetical protein
MSFSPSVPIEPPSPAIHWRLAWGVVALQGSLQLGWIIYRAYQPVLLSGHGFASLLVPFALVPGFLGLLIEPISGAFSDRWAFKARGRLLPITVSVLVAASVFLTIAGTVRGGMAMGNLLLPGLMLVWMTAVQATSSPGLALLNEAVSLKRLPTVAALLVLTQGVIGAFAGGLAQEALQLGPTFTLLLGATILALGLAVLRSAPTPHPDTPLSAQEPAPSPPLGRCALLLALALAIGALGQVLLELLPRVQTLAAAAPNLSAQTPVVLLSSALAAPFAGKLVTRWGHRGALLRVIPSLSVSLALTLLLPSAGIPPLLPLLGFLHSLLFTALTALGLSTLPHAWGGLGAGLVLGGSGLAGSLSLLHFGPGGAIAAGPVLVALAGCGGLALAGCVLLPQGLQRDSDVSITP